MSHRLALGGLAALGLSSVAVAVASRVPPAPVRAGDDPFATMLVDLAEVAVCLVAGWLAIATAACTLGVARGPGSATARVAAQLTPRVWGRALGVVLGGAVCLGQVSAHAAQDGSSTTPIVGLRLPDRPSGTAAPGPDQTSRPRVVHRGDTLWDIAEAALPAESTVAQTAAECRRWYAANRPVVGDDPDLLLPGTRLYPPSEEREGMP